MTTSEVTNYASAAATIIAAIYAIMTYHGRKGASVSNPSTLSQTVTGIVAKNPAWKPVVLVGMLAAIAWGAALFDQFSRSEELPDTYIAG
jgi:hypothetical protein